MPDQIEEEREEESEGLFGPDGRLRADPLVEETKQMVENTRRFLDSVRDSDTLTRRYVETLKKRLDDDLRLLKRGTNETSPRDR